jgi:hypothetical protein
VIDIKEQTIYTFSDEELRLLKQPIPINPCLSCFDSGSCCGCPEERKYQTTIKPYRDNNLLVFADTIRNIRKMHSESDRLLKRSKELNKEANDALLSLPEQLRKIV